ncbi:MAG TPA: 4Fe-4S binding protein, partial [Chloroflexota bacterium]|nr:4Fe-4S binding protein [Chloroflexota bacterium]
MSAAVRARAGLRPGARGPEAMARRGELAPLTRLLQIMCGLGLAYALLMALRQPVRAEANVGATTIWLLWWPLAPFLALAVGRLWCAACPFAGLSDLADAAATRLGLRRRAPGQRAQSLSAVWLPVSLVLLGIAFLALGLEMSGAMTLLVVGLFAAGCVGLALLLKGRAWCRFACPLGATLGLYAGLGAWTLRPLGVSGVSGSSGSSGSFAGGPRIVPFKC